jgi:hypothetical protein
MNIARYTLLDCERNDKIMTELRTLEFISKYKRNWKGHVYRTIFKQTPKKDYKIL